MNYEVITKTNITIKKMSKTLKLVLGIALFSVVLWSCKNEAEPKIKTIEVAETKAVKEIDANATIAKAEFTIEGMTCAIGCAKTIEKKLSKMEGVKSVTVDFDTKLAMVEYDEAKVTTTSLEKTVAKTSEQYIVSDMKTVESFSTDFAKGADKTKCDHKGKDCKKGSKGCKMGSKDAKAACAKDCKKACCADKA